MGQPARNEKTGAAAGVPRGRVERHLDLFLDVPRFKDYCPNGLQVEGSPRVSSVVSGVTASLALIRGAVRAGADTLLVHHGWFWRGEDPRILGPRRERLALVLAHRLNLFAQDMLQQAADAGADAFVSGEISERTTHLARELGVAYLAAGHHATERFGVQALGEHLVQTFGVSHRFIDDPNPV